MSFPEDTGVLLDDGHSEIPNELSEPEPKVTPWLLAHADAMCPRRLHAEYSCQPRTNDPFNRGRIREAVIDAIRTLHETGMAPPIPMHLEPEEQRVVAQALDWYPRLFAVEGWRVEVPIDEATDLPRREVRVGGWIDVCAIDDEGRRELRQLVFGARDLVDDPMDVPALRLAVLRLAHARWVFDDVLTVGWADLLSGSACRASLRIPDDLGPLAAWLDERLVLVRERMAPVDAQPGRDCTTCAFIPRCPAHEVRGKMWGKKSDRFPEILSISPTLLDAWHRCRRELGNRVLSVPPSDVDGGAAHGLYVHDLLRFIHHQGSCHDTALVADILRGNGADERVADEISKHAAKCPIDARARGHEVEWVRAHPKPPVFIASARLDAVWHMREADPVLEVRDYKTGMRWVDRLADDPRARLQAWIAAPRAAELGAKLRIRYEHLALEVDDDPEPWEPDDDDLEQIEEELRGLVQDMRAERDWKGVADEQTCRRCSYRSICPDSAAPGEPTWPSVLDSDQS